MHRRLRDLNSPVLSDSSAKSFGLHMSGLLVSLAGAEGEAAPKAGQLLEAYDAFMNVISVGFNRPGETEYEEEVEVDKRSTVEELMSAIKGRRAFASVDKVRSWL